MEKLQKHNEEKTEEQKELEKNFINKKKKSMYLLQKSTTIFTK